MSEDVLTECLKVAGLTALPDKWNGRGVWIRAIARVRTIYGYQWAIVRQDIAQKPTIVQSFGPSAIVLEYAEIYPYEVMTGRRRASIPTGQMRDFFTNNGIDADRVTEMLDTPATTEEAQAEKKDKIKAAIREVELRENDRRLSIEQRYTEHYNKSKELRSNGNATERKPRQANKPTSVKRQRRKMG